MEYLVHPKLIGMRRERFEERIDEILDVVRNATRPSSIHTFCFVWKVLLTDDENLKNVRSAHADRLSANRRVREMYLSLSMSKHCLPQKITVHWLRDKVKTVTLTHDIILLTLHHQLGLCS